MKLEKLLKDFNKNRDNREQALFTSIFIIQNRIQTSGEKLQKEISMKQWLLLTMTSICPSPKTLSNVGRMMGCSRQNIKKLALALEKKGFVKLVKGNNNSLYIELTNKVAEYSKEIGDKQYAALKILFKKFSDEEIKQFFNLVSKLYVGLENMENYTGGKSYEKESAE